MSEQFGLLIFRTEELITRIEAASPQALSELDWTASVACRHRKRRSGRSTLEPVRHVGAMHLSDLQEIDLQKEKIDLNTSQFVEDRLANNVLLTGARGTGKSSLIRVGLHEYADRGLRLVEVDKTDLVDLPDIVDLVADRTERFIVFCDDLSFDDGEAGTQGA